MSDDTSTPASDEGQPLTDDGFTVDQQRGGEKRAAATPDVDELAAAREEQYIEALLFEREGYARYGRDDRVDEVNAELKRRGYKAAEARSKAAPKGVKGRAAGDGDQATA